MRMDGIGYKFLQKELTESRKYLLSLYFSNSNIHLKNVCYE